jgi:hypothetical protein
MRKSAILIATGAASETSNDAGVTFGKNIVKGTFPAGTS